MMEPGVRKDHKTHPEAERNELWGRGQHGRLSNALCAQHESARGGLQMTKAGVWGRDQ